MKISWKLIYVVVIVNSIWSAMTSKRGGDDLLNSTALLNVGASKNIISAISLLFLSVVAITFFAKARLTKVQLSLLISSFLMFFGALLGSFFGERFAFEPRIFILPFSVLIILLRTPVSVTDIARFFRAICLFYAYASLFALAVLPQWAAEWNYGAGLIEGLNIRLHGISGHSNNLASMMVFYFILNIYLSGREEFSISSKLFNVINGLVVLINLFLCQSKTNWIVLILVILFYVCLDYARKLNRSSRYSFIGFSIFSIFIAVIVLSSNEDYVRNIVLLNLTESQLDRASSLTGRFEIWTVVIDGWRANPFFGYGPGIFSNEELYASTLGFTPSHAHNQIFQSIGEGGGIALIGLVWYCFVLLKISLSNHGDRCVLLLTILLFFFIRSLTQSVFRSGFDDTFTMHLMLLGLVVGSLGLSARKNNSIT